MGLGSRYLSHSSPNPNKPYGFWGPKAPVKKKLRSQSSGAVCTGIAILPCPIISPSLISLTVSVDVKHHARRSSGVRVQELCVQDIALVPYPSLPPSLINLTVSVDLKHHEERRSSGVTELRSCVYRNCCRSLSPLPTPPSRPSLISLIASTKEEARESELRSCVNTQGVGLSSDCLSRSSALP